MSGILHTSWLGKVISGWDHIRKLNAFEERFFAWILLIEDGARNEILSFAFLLFLWDNALKKLIIPLHFAECKPLIRTLNIILFSAHVLVSCDHTKTHRLLFYLFLILIDLDWLVHLKIFVFYHFYGHYFLSLPLSLSLSIYIYIVCDSLVLMPNNSFLFPVLQAWYLISHILHSFSKQYIVQLKCIFNPFKTIYWQLLRHTLQTLLNTSANNNVSFWTYKLWYSPKCFILKSLQTLFVCAKSTSIISCRFRRL